MLPLSSGQADRATIDSEIDAEDTIAQQLEAMR
jgi:hypothetical protein